MYVKTKYISFFLGISVIILLIFLTFQSNKYTATFVVDNTLYQKVKVIKNTKITFPSNPKKDGFSFIGWYDKEGNLINKDNTMQKDDVFYAKWAIITTE